MSTTCDACSAPAELYLCSLCTSQLRDALTALAQGPGRSQGLLANLADVTLKRTRMGGGTGHRKRGDELPGLYEPDTANGRRTKQGEAGMLLAMVANSLTVIIRDLCESRGIDPPTITEAARMAVWLAGNAHAIACGESAGLVHSEITGYVRRIERVIDRPEPPRFIGPCPAPDPKDERKRCNTGLAARPHAVEVTCPACKTTHNAERVEIQNLNEIEHMRFTRSELLMVLSRRGETLPRQTLHDWIRTGRLRTQGWRRPDGRIGTTRHSDGDKPVFRLSDVRRLRSEQPRKVKAG